MLRQETKRGNGSELQWEGRQVGDIGLRRKRGEGGIVCEGV